jgi:hypothetical protein
MRSTPASSALPTCFTAPIMFMTSEAGEDFGSWSQNSHIPWDGSCRPIHKPRLPLVIQGSSMSQRHRWLWRKTVRNCNTNSTGWRVAGQVSARFSMMEWSNQSHELAWTSGDFHSMAKLRCHTRKNMFPIYSKRLKHLCNLV